MRLADLDGDVVFVIDTVGDTDLEPLGLVDCDELILCDMDIVDISVRDEVYDRETLFDELDVILDDGDTLRLIDTEVLDVTLVDTVLVPDFVTLPVALLLRVIVASAVLLRVIVADGVTLPDTVFV